MEMGHLTWLVRSLESNQTRNELAMSVRAELRVVFNHSFCQLCFASCYFTLSAAGTTSIS